MIIAVKLILFLSSLWISFHYPKTGADSGLFRVKNHDFTPKNHIFSNFRGGGARRVRPPWIRPCISTCRLLHQWTSTIKMQHSALSHYKPDINMYYITWVGRYIYLWTVISELALYKSNTVHCCQTSTLSATKCNLF